MNQMDGNDAMKAYEAGGGIKTTSRRLRRRLKRPRSWLIAICILIPLVLAYRDSASPQTAVIALNPSVAFQTMNGWEATDQSGQDDSPFFPQYQSTLFDRAVNDLGINRIRLEIKNPSGSTDFDFAALDRNIEAIVLPLRQRLQQRGESLWLNVCYVGFRVSGAFRTNPIAYARAVLSAYRHIQSKYGFTPDSWEVLLEPDSGSNSWDGTEIAKAMVAAGDLLSANGFTVRFVAPSLFDANRTVTYFNKMQAVPEALRYLWEFSFHSYRNPGDGTLRDIGAIQAQYGINTSQLEFIGADYELLHRDLKLARVSAWQQYTLAYPAKDNGAQYYLIEAGNVQAAARTKFLRQYFRHIRRGALRIEATSTNTAFDPLAFINANGRYVVVVKADSGGDFSIQGLPDGTYGVSYTTESEDNIDLPDSNVVSRGDLHTRIPARGAIVVYAKSTTGEVPVGQARLDRCKVVRTVSGGFKLILYGENFKLGATVTVGGERPNTVKFKARAAPDQDIFQKLKVKGGFCEGLPGPIIVTNPGSSPSLPMQCNASCD